MQLLKNEIKNSITKLLQSVKKIWYKVRHVLQSVTVIAKWDVTNVVLPDSNIFLWIATSVADAAAVNPNAFKTLLANGLSIFLINGNPNFIIGPKSLLKNNPDCPILCNWAFDNFRLGWEIFPKVLQSFESYVLVANNLWGKLFSSLESPTTSK